MKLFDVKVGNVFLANGVQGKNIKVMGQGPGISAMLDTRCELIQPFTHVYPLCKIEEYDVTQRDPKIPRKNPVPVSDVQPGVVVELADGPGVMIHFCTTKHFSYSGRLCLELKWPDVMDPDHEVVDAGYAGDYSGVLIPESVVLASQSPTEDLEKAKAVPSSTVSSGDVPAEVKAEVKPA